MVLVVHIKESGGRKSGLYTKEVVVEKRGSVPSGGRETGYQTFCGRKREFCDRKRRLKLLSNALRPGIPNVKIRRGLCWDMRYNRHTDINCINVKKPFLMPYG